MNKLHEVVLSSVVIALLSGCSTTDTKDTKEISGECFRRTIHGPENLGFVTIYFLTEEQHSQAVDTLSKLYRETVRMQHQNDSIQAAKLEIKLAEFKKQEEYYRALQDLAKFDGDVYEVKKNYDKAELFRWGAAFARYDHPTHGNADSQVTWNFVKAYVDTSKLELVRCTTNSEGLFKVKLKKQKYWVFALAGIRVDFLEESHWLFEYMPTGKHNLSLNNDNLYK